MQGLDQASIEKYLEMHHYTFKEYIGKGGFGVVLKIFSEQYQIDFCAKILKKKPGSSINDCYEIQSLMEIINPNILYIYDYFIEGDYLFLITQYCPGGTVYDMVKKEGPLRYETFVSYARQLLLALKACHDLGIAHSDIKPPNILIDEYGRPILADFGLAKYYKESEISYEYSGTILLMAPEVLKKIPHDPFLADIWSLGITFYIMATGTTPWDTLDARKIKCCIEEAIITYPTNMNLQIRRFLQRMLKLCPTERASLEDLVLDDLFVKESPLKLTHHSLDRGSKLFRSSHGFFPKKPSFRRHSSNLSGVLTRSSVFLLQE